MIETQVSHSGAGMPVKISRGEDEKKGHRVVPFHFSGVEGWITPRLFNIDFPLAKR
jgi:hypothetical protein